MNTDLNLAGIIESARSAANKAALSAPDPNADLREAAEQFEAIFLNELLKQARKANLSGRVDLGVAEALVRQLGQRKHGKGKSD